MDKDEDQLKNNLLETIKSSSCDVSINIINTEFLNKIEVNKQYRKSVLHSENVHSVGSVTQNFQKLKVITMAILNGKKSQLLCGDVYLCFL